MLRDVLNMAIMPALLTEFDFEQAQQFASKSNNTIQTVKI
jgi:hypothetical protein